MAGAEFPVTRWESISNAKRGGPSSLDRLIRRYRQPVFEFLRLRGQSDADADDLTQEVFVRLVHEGVLQKARRDRGHFRSFLLAVTKNILREAKKERMARKRGGGKAPLSLDPGADSRLMLEGAVASKEQDEGFDKLWLKNLVQQALEAMSKETDEHAAFSYTLIKTFIDEKPSYEDLASRFGKTESQIKNALHAARLRLSSHLKTAIQDYCSSRGEFETELRYLKKFLP